MGVYVDIKANFLHEIARFRSVFPAAADLSAEFKVMSEDDFESWMIAEFVPALEQRNWPALHTKEMAEVVSQIARKYAR